MDTQQQRGGGESASQSTVLFRFVELFEQFTDALKKLQGAHAQNLEHSWQDYFGSDSPSFTREIDTVSLAALQCQLKMLTLLMETRLAELVPERATDPFAATEEAERYRSEAEAKLLDLYSRIRALAGKLQISVKATAPEAVNPPVAESPPEPQPAPQPMPQPASAMQPVEKPEVEENISETLSDDLLDSFEDDLDTTEDLSDLESGRTGKTEPSTEAPEQTDALMEEPIFHPDVEAAATDILEEDEVEDDTAAAIDEQKPEPEPAPVPEPEAQATPEPVREPQEPATAAATADLSDMEDELTDEDEEELHAGAETEISKPLNIDWEKAASQTPVTSHVEKPSLHRETEFSDEGDTADTEDMPSEADSALLQNAHAVLEEDLDLEETAEAEPGEQPAPEAQDASTDTSQEDDLSLLEESVNRLKRVHRDETDIRLKTNRGDWTLSLPYFAARDGKGKALLDVENFISVHNLAFRGVLDLANKTEHPDSEPKISKLVKKLHSYFIRLYENIHEVIGAPGTRIVPDCGSEVDSDTLLQLETELSMADWQTVNEVREFKSLFDEQVARPFVFYLENRENRKAYLESIASLAQTV